MLRRKTTLQQRELELQKAEIDRRIAQLKNIVNKLPARVRNTSNTMEAPEDIIDRRQTQRIHVAARKGSLQNTRRELGENVFLLILLILSITASSWWIFTLLRAS